MGECARWSARRTSVAAPTCRRLPCQRTLVRWPSIRCWLPVAFRPSSTRCGGGRNRRAWHPRRHPGRPKRGSRVGGCDPSRQKKCGARRRRSDGALQSIREGLSNTPVAVRARPRPGLAARSEYQAHGGIVVLVGRSHFAVGRFARLCGFPDRVLPRSVITGPVRSSLRVSPPTRVFPGTTLSRAAAAAQPLSWASVTLQHMPDTEVHLPRRVPPDATFRPQGLATLSTVSSLGALVGSVSRRQRSWASPFEVSLPARRRRCSQHH